MQKNIFILTFLAFLLFGCVSPHKQQYLQQQGKFTETRMVCETVGTTIFGYGNRNVFISSTNDAKPTCGPFKRPTFAEYRKNPSYWHEWHGSSQKSRILGIVTPGTHYRITDITSASDAGGGYFYYVTILDGQLAGVTNAQIHMHDTPDF